MSIDSAPLFSTCLMALSITCPVCIDSSGWYSISCGTTSMSSRKSSILLAKVSGLQYAANAELKLESSTNAKSKCSGMTNSFLSVLQYPSAAFITRSALSVCSISAMSIPLLVQRLVAKESLVHEPCLWPCWLSTLRCRMYIFPLWPCLRDALAA